MDISTLWRAYGSNMCWRDVKPTPCQFPDNFRLLCFNNTINPLSLPALARISFVLRSSILHFFHSYFYFFLVFQQNFLTEIRHFLGCDRNMRRAVVRLEMSSLLVVKYTVSYQIGSSQYWLSFLTTNIDYLGALFDGLAMELHNFFRRVRSLHGIRMDLNVRKGHRDNDKKRLWL